MSLNLRDLYFTTASILATSICMSFLHAASDISILAMLHLSIFCFNYTHHIQTFIKFTTCSLSNSTTYIHTVIKYSLSSQRKFTSQQLGMKKFLMFIGFKESSWQSYTFLSTPKLFKMSDFQCETNVLLERDGYYINMCALVMSVYWFTASSCHSYAKTRILISVCMISCGINDVTIGRHGY